MNSSLDASSKAKTRAIRDLALSERDYTLKETSCELHNADKSPIKLEKSTGEFDIELMIENHQIKL